MEGALDLHLNQVNFLAILQLVANQAIALQCYVLEYMNETKLSDDHLKRYFHTNMF